MKRRISVREETRQAEARVRIRIGPLLGERGRVGVSMRWRQLR